MSKCIIGFGKFSKYHLLLLASLFFKILNNLIFESLDEISTNGIFGFTPVLSRHIIIKNLYRCISFILGGYLFSYIFRMKFKKKKENNSDVDSIVEKNKLIYTDLTESLSFDQKEVIITCLLYFFSEEAYNILCSFDFNDLEIWTFDIVFILYFMKKYFVLNFYIHEKLAIYLVIIPVTVFSIVSIFLPRNLSEGGKQYTDINTIDRIGLFLGHGAYSIPIFLAFAISSLFTNLSTVKTKVLMELSYVSPYLLIVVIGMIGTFSMFITLIIVSFFKCPDQMTKYCQIYNINNNSTIYYENALIYFKNLGNSGNKVFIEVLIIFPLFLLINFCGFLFDILIIYYFNPLYNIIVTNLYYLIINLILFFFGNEDEDSQYGSSSYLIILEVEEFITVIGFLIYLEIIELRFWGLDHYIKRNFTKRAVKDAELVLKINIGDDDLDNDDEIEN